MRGRTRQAKATELMLDAHDQHELEATLQQVEADKESMAVDLEAAELEIEIAVIHYDTMVVSRNWYRRLFWAAIVAWILENVLIIWG